MVSNTGSVADLTLEAKLMAPGFTDRQWRFITTILFLAELLTFFVMGWLIHAVVNSDHDLSISYHDAYLVAALAPLPLWSAAP